MKFVLFLLIFIIPISTWGQVDINQQSINNPEVDLGVGVKLSAEFGKFSNFQIGLGGGIGKRFEFVYPNAHVDFQIYKGGIGSSLLDNQRKKIHFDVTTSIGLVAGIRVVNDIDLSEKFNPINYFGSFSVTPLNNPYWNSIYLGTNLIWFSDDYLNPQRVGAININAERSVQFTYYNDGSFFPNFIGDGHDRYHTGGGGFFYYGKFTDPINYVKLTFSRFTTFQQYAFDSSNQLQVDLIAYKDQKGFYYNQGRLKLTIGNYENGFGLSALIYNWKDIQNLIHLVGDYAYHPNTLGSRRIMLGGEFMKLKYYQ